MSGRSARDRIVTPFFPVGVGEDAPRVGGKSPSPKAAQEMIGRIVGNGRYLLKQKTDHSTEMVRFSAIDAYGGLEVHLDLIPDRHHSRGFRMANEPVFEGRTQLPDLWTVCFTQEIAIPHQPSPLSSLWERVCQVFQRLFTFLG